MNRSPYQKNVYSLEQAKFDSQELNATSLRIEKTDELLNQARTSLKLKNYQGAENQCRAALYTCGVPKGFLKQKNLTPEMIVSNIDTTFRELATLGFEILKDVITASQDVISPKQSTTINLLRIDEIVHQLKSN